MNKAKLKNNIFVGVVVDNNDPDRVGRCRVRVVDVFDRIPVDDIPWAKPWKDLGGNAFSVPEKGKVVSVIFDNGSIYKPEFICAEHYNINLENKLSKLDDNDYKTFKSVVFDHSTQIYRTKSQGLMVDHEYTNINLDESGHINLNLKNNSTFLRIGTETAAQQAVLGNHFMNWMDKLIDALGATPYVGNMFAPCFPAPPLKPILAEYRAGRQSSKFLSKNVYIVDNGKINTQTRDYINQDGDKWKSTVELNKLTKTKPTPAVKEPDSPPVEEIKTMVMDQIPVGIDIPSPEVGAYYMLESQAIVKTGYPILSEIPPDILSRNINKEGTGGPQSITRQIGDYPNGRIPYKEVFKLSERLKSDIPKGANTKDEDPYHLWWLYPPMAEGWDALMAEHDKAVYPGKYPSVISMDGYRTYLRQKEMVDSTDEKTRNLRATPGTSPHGSGSAVDVGWGIDISLSDDTETYMGAIYRHPTYQWFWHNSYKYGIYNPLWARDGINGYEEWWHWEYDPRQNKKYPDPDLIAKYSGAFTLKDWQTLYKLNGAKVKYMESEIKKYGFILLYDKSGNFLYDKDGKFLGADQYDPMGNYKG